MSSTRYARLHDVFRAACDLQGSEREHCVDRLCGDDADLRAEVLRLLAQDAPESDFLKLSPRAIPVADCREAPSPQPLQVGRYRILRKLGEGGMGVVYLAEQDTPRRHVALKLLRTGAASRARLDRFRQEAEVLARLQHPGIAQIYEAGTDDSGAGPQPYFAMEYIAGQPLVEFAAARALAAAARLGLIAQICQAVHHAHQKGVIHRDLKPANVLVTESGQPKVLDFGVARATDADLQASLHTSAGELLGTVPYMSPEQAAGDPHEIDTRSDVYALGVVAYELLTGRLPHALGRKLLPEALRIIREDAPAPLSSIDRRLRGDVETIISKALAKDRQRRYPSAAALADDIERYLHDQPIAARPPSAAYHLSKFARRHTALVASAAVIALLLVAGISVTTWQAFALAAQRDQALLDRRAALEARRAESTALADARREKAEAEKGARTSNAIAGFLADILTLASPNVGRHDMTVAEAVDIAAQRVQEKLADDPDVAALVHVRLSTTYQALGKVEASLEQARAALAIMHARNDSDPGLITQISERIAGALYEKADWPALADVMQTALPVARQLPPEDPRRISLMNTYGAMLYAQQKYEQAEPVMRENYEISQRASGPRHPRTLNALNGLANVTRQLGRAAEGEELTRQCMDLHRQFVGDKHPNTIASIYNYGDLLRERGRPEEAAAVLGECVDLGRRHLPTRHWLAGNHRSGYGDVLRELKRYDEAEAQLLDAYGILESQLGPQHERTRKAAARLTLLYEQWGKSEAAAEWRRKSE